MEAQFQEVLKGLEEEGELLRKDILRKANEERKTIIDEANREALLIKKEAIERETATLKSEVTKILNAACFDLNRELMKTKEDLCDQVFNKVEEKLKEIKDTPEYRKIMKALIREALDQLPVGYALRVPNEEVLAIELLNKLGVARELGEEDIKKAAQKLTELRHVPRFRDLIQEILESTAKSVSGKVSVRVCPEDEKIAREILDEEGVIYNLEANLEAIGGVELSTIDGAITVTNTFDSRLKRAREALRSEVISILFGE